MFVVDDWVFYLPRCFRYGGVSRFTWAYVVTTLVRFIFSLFRVSNVSGICALLSYFGEIVFYVRRVHLVFCGVRSSVRAGTVCSHIFVR